MAAKAKDKHADRAHAMLGASAAHRWMHCPRSARLCEQFENTSSDYALEGTFAHEVAEIELLHRTGKTSTTVYNDAIKKAKKHKFYTAALREHVMQYVLYALEAFSEIQKLDDFAELLIEKKIDFSAYVPEGFGANDAIVAGSKKIVVIDLKFGMGLKVEALKNPQLMLYALGGYLELGKYEEYDTVKMVIVQPRLDHISEWEIPVTELIDWAENELKPAALLANAGGGEFCAGSWCKFCPAKPQCAALAKANLELAKHEFKEPDLLTDDQIADVLSRLDVLTDWASSVKAFALKEAIKGTKWPGYKLVAGRSNRYFTDPDKVALLLEVEGFTEDRIFRKSMIPMGEVEKLIGKKDFQIILPGLVAKSVGAPTLVVESDKRPELNNLTKAQNEFNDEFNDQITTND